MKRLLILPALAMAFGLLVPSAHADPDVPGSGSACGSSASIDPLVAGTLAGDGSDEDWYDVSYGTAGERELKVTSHAKVPKDPTNPLSWIGSAMEVELYEWDQAANTCTLIFENSCGIGTCNPVSLAGGGWDGVVTQPGPGDYQLRLLREPWQETLHPVAYTVNVQQ